MSDYFDFGTVLNALPGGSSSKKPRKGEIGTAPLKNLSRGVTGIKDYDVNNYLSSESLLQDGLELPPSESTSTQGPIILTGQELKNKAQKEYVPTNREYLQNLGSTNAEPNVTDLVTSEPTTAQHIRSAIVNPAGTFGQLSRGEEVIPDLPQGINDVTGMLNPAWYMDKLSKGVGDLTKGEYASAGWNLLAGSPALGPVAKAGLAYKAASKTKKFLSAPKSKIFNQGTKSQYKVTNLDPNLKQAQTLLNPTMTNNFATKIIEGSGKANSQAMYAKELAAKNAIVASMLKGNKSKSSAGVPNETGRRWHPAEKVEEVMEGMAKGADDFDDYIKERLTDLKSKEGFKRLVNQELELLNSKKAEVYSSIPDVHKLSLNDKINYATKSAKARIDELEATQFSHEREKYALWSPTKNRKIKYALDQGDLQVLSRYQLRADISKNLGSFRNNAYWSGAGKYSPRTRPVYGELSAGLNLLNRKVFGHEFGHALQRGEVLPIDKFLSKNIKPKMFEPSKPFEGEYGMGYDKLNHGKIPGSVAEEAMFYNPQAKAAYDYFKTGGSKVFPSELEPSAFAHELREVLLEKGFIKHRYDNITPKLLEKAYNTPSMRNVKTKIDKDYNKFDDISHTRIFDFMKETPSNFRYLSAALNKLPITTGAIGTGALLSQDK